MKIGFIGFGRMGSALAKGAVAARIIKGRDVMATSPSGSASRGVKAVGGRFSRSIADVVKQADQVWICVKPQKMGEVLPEIAGAHKRFKNSRRFYVSIAAGITTQRIEKALGKGSAVVRVMPNTPAMLLNGMSAVSRGSKATAQHEKQVLKVLSAVGETVTVREKLMDAVTAVSGSGPAYVFYLAEAMIVAAKKLGFSASAARILVHQTIYGAGLMLKRRWEDARELRRQVTSPGGTTEAAIREFDRRGLKKIVIEAVRRAERRSKELSKK